MIRTTFVKMLIIASTFVSCSMFNSCSSNNAGGDISVTLEGQMGAFNEAKTVSTLNLSASPNTALKNVNGYKIPTPYFEEVQFFGYWSLDAEGKNVVDENYVIKNDTTFYAQYSGEFPEGVSYILFDSAAYSSLDLNRSMVCFTASPVRRSEKYNLRISSNVPDGQMVVCPMEIESPDEETVYDGDTYGCIFDHSGPIVIKIEGYYNAFSFTKLTLVEYIQPMQKIAVPISSGNNHILAFASNDYMQNISKYGFQSLSNLKAVHCSKYAKEIGLYAFSGCTSLEYISNMSYLTKISNSAFFDCRKLKHFHFSSFLSEIGNNAFEGCLLLKSFVCPRTCTVVGRCAFANCINLTDVVFEEGNLSSIANEAFMGCTSLRHIRLPKSLRHICAEAFANCTNLTDVTFVNGSTPLEISESIFANCLNLNKIVLPRQAIYICDGCFQSSNLSELDLSRINSVIDYKTNLFKYTPLASKQGKIIVSQNLLSAYQSASGWSDYKDIIVTK